MARVVVSEVFDVTLFDSGDSILISGAVRGDVERVLKEFVATGATLARRPQEVGSNWTATCRLPECGPGDIQVAHVANHVFVRGGSIGPVQARVRELTDRGWCLEGRIENVDDIFIAHCQISEGGI